MLDFQAPRKQESFFSSPLLIQDRAEAKVLFASEEEVQRESAKIVVETPSNQEAAKDDQTPKTTAPTPEQILAIKAAIVNSQTLEEVAKLEQVLHSVERCENAALFLSPLESFIQECKLAIALARQSQFTLFLTAPLLAFYTNWMIITEPTMTCICIKLGNHILSTAFSKWEQIHYTSTDLDLARAATFELGLLGTWIKHM